jgi:hypothetical protein
MKRALPTGNTKDSEIHQRKPYTSHKKGFSMISKGFFCGSIVVLCLSRLVAADLPDASFPRRKHYNTWSPSASTSSVIHSLIFQGSPRTPASILEPWYRRIKDPHPLVPLEELEECASQKDIDEVVNQVVGSEPGIVIQRFRPYPNWLWRQWFGTVLFHTAGNVMLNMGVALIFCLIIQRRTFGDWNIFHTLPAQQSFPRLEAIDKIWKTLMSLATFLLTFFVGQAYTFWRSIYDQARGVQGRMNDINMLLAANGAPALAASGGTKGNINDTNDKNSSKEYYTDDALTFLNRVAAKMRVCHLLFWAANAPRFRVLLTPRGLDRLVQVGYLPQALKTEVLDATHGLGPTEKWCAMLESALMDCIHSLHKPQTIYRYSTALELALQELFCRLRAHLATIPDLVDGRMPLAYAHFVQILVDLFLMVAPVAQ